MLGVSPHHWPLTTAFNLGHHPHPYRPPHDNLAPNPTNHLLDYQIQSIPQCNIESHLPLLGLSPHHWPLTTTLNLGHRPHPSRPPHNNLAPKPTDHLPDYQIHSIPSHRLSLVCVPAPKPPVVSPHNPAPRAQQNPPQAPHPTPNPNFTAAAPRTDASQGVAPKHTPNSPNKHPPGTNNSWKQQQQQQEPMLITNLAPARCPRRGHCNTNHR